MIRALAFLGLCAIPVVAYCTPCRAETRTMTLYGTAPRTGQTIPTTITLQPTKRAGALAEIVMHNVDINYSTDETSADLTLGALVVNVGFDWEADTGGADAAIVTPPAGVVCLPRDCRLVVPEGGTGTLYLFSVEGVGM